MTTTTGGPSGEVSIRILRPGAAVVFPNFSLSPEGRYPTAIEEIYAVLEWVAQHGPRRLALPPGPRSTPVNAFGRAPGAKGCCSPVEDVVMNLNRFLGG